MEGLFQNDLILLKKLEDFYSLFYIQFKKLPKRDRYALGLKIENLIIEMLTDLYEFNIKKTPREKKIKILDKFDTNLPLLKYYFRLLYANQAFDLDKYTFFEAKLLELGKILGGLIKKYSPKEALEESKKE